MIGDPMCTILSLGVSEIHKTLCISGVLVVQGMTIICFEKHHSFKWAIFHNVNTVKTGLTSSPKVTFSFGCVCLATQLCAHLCLYDSKYVQRICGTMRTICLKVFVKIPL